MNSLVLERPYVRPNHSNMPEVRGRWRPFQLAFISDEPALNQRDRQSEEAGRSWTSSGFPPAAVRRKHTGGLTAFAALLASSRKPGQRWHNSADALYIAPAHNAAVSARSIADLRVRENSARKRRAISAPHPISIGLWVGGDVTPIRHDEAEREFRTCARAAAKPVHHA